MLFHVFAFLAPGSIYNQNSVSSDHDEWLLCSKVFYIFLHIDIRVLVLLYQFFFLFSFLINLFIFGYMGFRCCVQAFASCGERGPLFIAVHGLLIAVASLVVETRLWGLRASVVVARGLSSCGSQVQ